MAWIGHAGQSRGTRVIPLTLYISLFFPALQPLVGASSYPATHITTLYTVRPLDLLRMHHERIEAWILEQAGVKFDSASEVSKLRVVA